LATASAQVCVPLGHSSLYLHAVMRQVSVDNVAGAVKSMLLQLSWSRQNYVDDYYVVRSNNECVQRWSLMLCVMIVLTSALQVAVVRRLFHCPDHVTKERA